MTDRSAWQKSSFSEANSNCVEVQAPGGAIELRESDDAGAIIRTTPANFAALLRGAQAGEFDRHTT